MHTLKEDEFRKLFAEAILIGSDDESSDYLPAVIGAAKDGSRIAYSRIKLERCFMKKNNWSWEEASEWIDYNVERALSYYGEHAPVLLNNNFINSNNTKYDPIKII